MPRENVAFFPSTPFVNHVDVPPNCAPTCMPKVAENGWGGIEGIGVESAEIDVVIVVIIMIFKPLRVGGLTIRNLTLNLKPAFGERDILKINKPGPDLGNRT